MSYFDPCEDFGQLLLSFHRESFYYPLVQSPFKDLDLDINLNFQGEQFNYAFEHKIQEKLVKIQEEQQSSQVIIKKRKIPKPRYQKNICGYILKKVFRAFVCTGYKDVALYICEKYCTSFEQARKFCLDKMEKLNGISHLYLVLMPAVKQQVAMMLTLLEFTQWFVQERYIRHLVIQGKMSNKTAYINFKNIFFPREIKNLKRLINQFVDNSSGNQ